MTCVQKSATAETRRTWLKRVFEMFCHPFLSLSARLDVRDILEKSQVGQQFCVPQHPNP